MVGAGMFDNAFLILLGVGATIGAAMVGLIWFLVWLFSHVSITITWV